MTIRLGHKRRPPFLFSQRARPVNIPCKPVITHRDTSTFYFAELCTAPGPHTIGVTGDNSFDTLFGREWLVVWCEGDLKLHTFQEDADIKGKWQEITSLLPPVFDSPLPATSRRVTFCFDQSARMIVAYEDEGVVKVTRWDASTNQYVQNVSFSGTDPCLAMDATWVGRIPGSDVLLFYLSPDRTKVLCRVQAQTYGTEHELHAYDAPVILDRVTPLAYRYQLLLADASGEPLDHALVSSLYPLATRAELRVAGEFHGGAYDLAAYEYKPTVVAALAGEFTAGALTSPVVKVEPLIGVAVAGAFVAGALEDVVTKYQPQLDVRLTGEFISGELADIGTRVERILALGLAGEFVGGAYEPG